jgi:uncharacterized protein
LNLRPVFYSGDGTLRTGWRLALFLAVTIATTFAAFAIVAPLMLLIYRAAGLEDVSVNHWALLAGLAGAHWVMLRFVDRRPWSFVALGRNAAHPSRWLEGFVIGGLAIALPIVLLLALGWLTREPWTAGAMGAAILGVTLLLLPAALWEELLARGYLFSVLRERWGWPWALAATSLGFAALHIENVRHIGENITGMQAVLVVGLAGVLLGGIVIVTGSLYAAWMAHFAWNWVMAAVFHVPVSGWIEFPTPNYRFVDSGPDWATGGAWGPEGGLFGALGMVAAIAYLIWRYRRRAEAGANV